MGEWPLLLKIARAKNIRSEASPCESIGISIDTNSSHPLYIFSVYSPPLDLDLSGLPALFDDRIPTIVAGDLNAKHTAWGCHHINPKGDSLSDLICDHHLSIEAPTKPTHYPG